MTDTPPGRADQDQPQPGYGPQGGRPWPDRPEFGQPTTPRDRPPADQPGLGQQTGQAGYGQPPYGQQQPTAPDRGEQATQLPSYAQYGQQTQNAQQAQYPQQAQYGQQAPYGQAGFGSQTPPFVPSYQRSGWTAGAPAPGGVPLRPLGFSDMLSGTFTLIRQNPVATVGLIAIGAVAGMILVIIFGFIANRSGTAGGALLSYIPSFVIDAAVGGGVIAAIGQAMLGRKIGISEALGLSRLGWVLLTGLIYGVIMGAVWFIPLVVLHGFGILISFPLGAWLGIMLCLMIPVVVLERQNSFAAMSRSWQLVKGSFWRFFGIFALLFVVAFFLSFAFAIVISVAAGVGLTASHGSAGVATGTIIASAVLYLLISLIVVALWTALIVLLYADARMRKEGMDLVLQHAAQNQQLTGDEFARYVPGQAGGGGAGGYPGSGGGYPGTGGGYPGTGGGYPGTGGGYPGTGQGYPGASGGYPGTGGGYPGAGGGYPGTGQGYPGASDYPGGGPQAGGYQSGGAAGGYSGNPPPL